MRRFLCVLLVVGLGWAWVGCGQSAPKKEPTKVEIQEDIEAQGKMVPGVK